MKITVEQAEFLKRQHVHIGMPMYQGVLHGQTFTSLLPFFLTAVQTGMKTSLGVVSNSSIVSLARCVITADFLKAGDATHLLWVDSDMTFDPNAIFQLLLHDKDVVGALCPPKSFPLSYCADFLPEAIGSAGFNTTDGLTPVAHIGTGFMLIKRQAIEEMIAAYPKTKFNDPQSSPERNRFMYSLWENGVNGEGNFMGEDWMFCERWRAIGGKMWADPSLIVNHIGTFTYSLDKMQTLTSLGAKGGNLNLAPQITICGSKPKPLGLGLR